MARNPARAPLTEPVFPTVLEARGHYESYYLRAVAPDRPRAVWIRYTVHKAPGAAPVGSLWCTLFEDDGTPPRTVKQTFSSVQPQRWIQISDFTLGPGFAEGHAAALGHEGSWRLHFDEGDGPVHHLPRPWMYTARFPRTKTLSPVSDAQFSGYVEVDGHRVDVSGWRGMAGHNWGAEHAERWIWLHGLHFEDAPDAWVDLVAGRIRIGRMTLPWVANGVLHLDGQRHVLGGIGAARRTSVRETPQHATLRVPPVRLEVTSPLGQIATWPYSDPDGGSHHSAHCSVAALEVRLGDRVLRTPHGACFELGMRETDHGLPVQPFPDP